MNYFVFGTRADPIDNGIGVHADRSRPAGPSANNHSSDCQHARARRESFCFL